MATLSKKAWHCLFDGTPPESFDEAHYQARAERAAKLDAARIERVDKQISFIPECFLAVRMLFSKNGSPTGACEVLMAWEGYAERDNTWEPTSTCKKDRATIEALVQELRAVYAKYGLFQLATDEDSDSD